MIPTPLQQTLCNGLLCGLKVSKKGEIHNIAHVSNKTLALVSTKGIGEVWKRKFDRLPSYIKPILFSLDMLDKEIEINGRKFIPAEVLWSVSENDLDNFQLYGEIPAYWQEMMRNDIKRWDFGDVQKLIQWHFNVFNLPEDQYVKVTDNFNPYK